MELILYWSKSFIEAVGKGSILRGRSDQRPLMKLDWELLGWVSWRKGCSRILRMPIRESGSLLRTISNKARQEGESVFGKTMIELTWVETALLYLTGFCPGRCGRGYGQWGTNKTWFPRPKRQPVDHILLPSTIKVKCREESHKRLPCVLLESELPSQSRPVLVLQRPSLRFMA